MSPFLVLSRHNAQQPLRRLRFPREKQRNRKRYALAFYIGTAFIVGGLIGSWTWWCLGSRNPWTWALFYILQGRKQWSRPALLAYWALLGSLSVAGWIRQMARSRKYRTKSTTDSPTAGDSGGPTTLSATSSTGSSGATGNASTLTMTFGSLPMPNIPNGAVPNVATDLLDAADKHVPTLRLNARRKFFHALAVAMFVPGVASDVSGSADCKQDLTAISRHLRI